MIVTSVPDPFDGRPDPGRAKQHAKGKAPERKRIAKRLAEPVVKHWFTSEEPYSVALAADILPEKDHRAVGDTMGKGPGGVDLERDGSRDFPKCWQNGAKMLKLVPSERREAFAVELGFPSFEKLLDEIYTWPDASNL